jgi:hypothetical protein
LPPQSFGRFRHGLLASSTGTAAPVKSWARLFGPIICAANFEKGSKVQFQKPQKTRGVIRSDIRLIHPDVLVGSAIGLTVVEIILFLAYRSYVPICGLDEVKPALRLTILAVPVLVSGKRAHILAASEAKQWKRELQSGDFFHRPNC